jgi:5-methylcytosine-specific restriction endonuclease McrA
VEDEIKENKRPNKKYYKYLIKMVGECELCGRKDNLVVHHIKRIHEGGKDIPRNCQILCRECHRLIHYNEPGLRRK